MEHEINFLALEKLHSDKKQKDYFKLSCLLDNKTADIFIDEDTYKKLSIRDLKYLKSYLACFKVVNRFGSVALDLTDLKELK